MTKTSSADWLLYWSARGAFFTFVSLFVILGQGCSGVSEEDLNNLKLENQALEAELELEKKQSEILNRSLTNVYKERDRLADLLNAPPPPPSPPIEENDQQTSQSPSGSQTTQTSQRRRGNQTYIVQTGDTLSSVAQKHDTNIDTILKLNPYLRTRNNYMVWQNDRIIVP
ncbi:MAG: LysM peptidoglycan-binding domain-containing protein [Deltaproteobacteria bacterium]|nr:LysM peptidoglycan-binding domain-containing protein [Deltaproteobacteria bacterium]